MTQHTFALITSTETHYVDVTRLDGDERSWRDLVLEHGLAAGVITSEEVKTASVLPAVRPSPPGPIWR